ncbi:transglutaminaseTgpA domain-containing protein [Amycolatopsis sp. NPDC059027]|uniref:transglutaminase family protein n=1 Tax=Amycolatopsis sp. NPDC059027 TaxID=3346709 RepID=UPI00366AC282
MTPRLPAAGFRLAEVALCGLAAGAGGLLYGRFFATGQYLPPLCAAAAGGALTAAVAGFRGWRAGRTLLVTAGGFLLLAWYSVLEHGLPGRNTAGELARGVLGGWSRMLTVALPADVRGDLLATPLLLTWFAAATAVSLALRTRPVLVPIAPTLFAFVAGLLLVGRQPGLQLVPTAMFLAASLLLMVLRARSPATVTDRAADLSRLRTGVPVVLVIALLGAGGLLLPLATGEHRFDPRVFWPPPRQQAETLSPLVTLKSQLREEPPRRLFTIRVGDGGAGIDRVRVAALDDFDGVLWTCSDRFLTAGHQLPGVPGETRTHRVSAHITVDELRGPFLPVLGRPARLAGQAVDAGDFSIGTDSGVLVTNREFPRGLGYDLTGAIGDRDHALPQASPAISPGTALPGLPQELSALALQLTATEPTPYGKLAAIERYLRDLPYRLDAPPGHSYGAISRIVAAGGQSDAAGFAEQHASAFAVFARALGFPARVAVGYRLSGRAHETQGVTTRDADAWAEVRFDAYGWIPFDPTDPAKTSPPSPHDGDQAAPAGARPPRPNPPIVAPPHTGALSAPRAPGDVRPSFPPRGPVLAAVLALTCAALTATLIVGAKAGRRRRRRHAEGNPARILGAWNEAVDRLRERGVTMTGSMTAGEAACHAASVLGPATGAVTALAPLATAAVFARDVPGDEAVRQAWVLEARLREELYPRRPVRRLLARLDPRPLWPQRRGARKPPPQGIG